MVAASAAAVSFYGGIRAGRRAPAAANAAGTLSSIRAGAGAVLGRRAGSQRDTKWVEGGGALQCSRVKAVVSSCCSTSMQRGVLQDAWQRSHDGSRVALA